MSYKFKSVVLFLKISKKFATCETYFLFNGKFYDQIDGVAMGSPLAPVLANLFMGHNEKLWLENFQGTPPSYYRRYVDDIFSVFNNSFEAKEFFNYINTRHPNIKFTMETKVNKIIPFLDVFLTIANIFLKLRLIINLHILVCFLITLVLHLAFKK